MCETPPLGWIALGRGLVDTAPLHRAADAPDAPRYSALAALHADTAVFIELLCHGVGFLLGRFQAEVTHGEGPFLGGRRWGDGAVDPAAIGRFG